MKYTKAFEVAQLALSDLKSRDYRFKDGVERAAALAAVEVHPFRSEVDAIERTFQAYRLSPNPNWDGSIA